MSARNQTVAIGAFVVGALVILGVVLIYLLGTGLGDREKVIMVFDGSVKGLKVGAPLALRGVQVGQVTDIQVILDSNNLELIMLVEADLDTRSVQVRGGMNDRLTEELIEQGLRAQLNVQSLLTGLLYIQLDFFPDTEIKLAQIDSPHFQFPTVPTDLEKITRKLQEVDITRIVDDVNALADSLHNMVKDEQFVQIPANLNSTLTSLEALSGQLQTQLASTGPKLDSMLDESTTAVASVNAELPQIAELISGNLKLLDDAILAFEQTLKEVDGLVSGDSATVVEINRALQEVSRAGRSLQTLANTLERQPEALLRGKSGE